MQHTAGATAVARGMSIPAHELQGCGLRCFPPPPLDGTIPRQLNLRHNRLEGICPADVVAVWSHLVSLDVAANGDTLCSLNGIQALPHLRVLCASMNQLTSLEPLSSLTSLEVLDLSSNRIESFKSLEACKQLRILNLAGNRISEMSDLTGHTSLVELNLRRNALTTLTTTSAPPAAATVPASAVTGPCVSISQPSAVQGVQTGGTATAGPTAAVECRSALPGGVHRLVLSHNRFRSLAALEPLSSLTSLTELQVEGCPLARAMGPPAFRAGVLSLCAQAQQLEVLDMQQVHRHEQVMACDAQQVGLAVSQPGTTQPSIHGVFEPAHALPQELGTGAVAQGPRTSLPQPARQHSRTQHAAGPQQQQQIQVTADQHGYETIPAVRQPQQPVRSTAGVSGLGPQVVAGVSLPADDGSSQAACAQPGWGAPQAHSNQSQAVQQHLAPSSHQHIKQAWPSQQQVATLVLGKGKHTLVQEDVKACIRGCIQAGAISCDPSSNTMISAQEAAQLVNEGASFVAVSIQPGLGKSRQSTAQAAPPSAVQPPCKQPAVQMVQATGCRPQPGCLGGLEGAGEAGAQCRSGPDPDAHIDIILEHTHFDVPALIAALQQQHPGDPSSCGQEVSTRSAASDLQTSTGQQPQRQAAVQAVTADSRVPSSSSHHSHHSLQRHSHPGTQAHVADRHLPNSRQAQHTGSAVQQKEQDKAKLVAEFEAAWKETVKQLALDGWEGRSGHALQAWAAGEVPDHTPGSTLMGPAAQVTAGAGTPASAPASRWCHLTGVTWATSSWSAWGF